MRGTPQQIIEKYLTLARDAQLSNDRVAEQSFLQHAEHYTRMLGEAQREQAERQQHQQQSHRDDDSRDGGMRDNGNGNANGEGRSHDRAERNDQQGQRRDDRQDRQHDRQPSARHDSAVEDRGSEPGLPLAIADEEDSGPVATPEGEMTAVEPVPEVAADAAPAPRRRSRAAPGTAAPRAPRSRKKPVDTDGPQPDKASGE